jgi:hypothetical protein
MNVIRSTTSLLHTGLSRAGSGGTRSPRRLPFLVSILAALCLALLGSSAGAADAAVPKPRASSPQVTAATVSCPYKYLCLYEGTGYTGTMHRLYNCEVYYTAYPIHSVKNNQTPGTRASFRDYNNAQFWVSPGAYWASSNTDGIAGSLNRAWYVKPC